MLEQNFFAALRSAFGWQLEDDSPLHKVEAAAAKGEPVAVYQDAGRSDWWKPLGAWPHSFERITEWPQRARWRALLAISDRVLPKPPQDLERMTLVFRPPTLTVGIASRRGVTTEEVEECVAALFQKSQLCPSSLTALASLHSRKNEMGLIDFTEERQIPFLTYAPDKLALLPRGARTEEPRRKLHLADACEPAAMLAAGVRDVVVKKTVFPRMALAVARRATG
jgi:cobalamin biosynthesis protein CbiG